MKALILLVLGLILGGCGSGEAARKCQTACVEVGGGELQPGLTLDLGCGQFIVNEVVGYPGAILGFKVTSFPGGFYAVQTASNTVCDSGREFTSVETIQRVFFCAADYGVDNCADTAFSKVP